MGTPAFACPILEALAARPDPVVGVVSQPDRPKGRGLAVVPTPVKEVALRHGIPVLQPEKVRTPEFADALRAFAPDVIVVAAYGRILPRHILDLPPHGCINVHASLLPRHRGAAPIAHAILAGDTVTGVTIMAMAEEMDAGDMLLARETPIGPNDTTGTLTARLSELGATAIGDAIDGLHAGSIRPVPQPADGVTFAPRVEREQGRIDWRRGAADIDRLVRAFTPAPTAFTTLSGKVVKIHRAVPGGDPGTKVPGTVVEAGPAGIMVATGDGALRILELQLEGKRRLDAGAFVAGQRLAPGTCLGDA